MNCCSPGHGTFLQCHSSCVHGACTRSGQLTGYRTGANPGLATRRLRAGCRASSARAAARWETCDCKRANKIHFGHIILTASGVLAADSTLELILSLQTFLWGVCTDQVQVDESAEAAVVPAGFAVILSSIERSLKLRHRPLSSSFVFGVGMYRVLIIMRNNFLW